MPFRNLMSDLKTYPITWAFCLAWIGVFIAMVVEQGIGGSPASWPWPKLILGMTNGSQFGDLTIRDLRHGEAWRLITCTFVHFGLVHLGVNLLAMYQLGTIVESWYGSYQMILVYALTGGLGNLVSVVARLALGYQENIHSGGGSVVLLGLVGLCAVVGWRSGTPRGGSLCRQMIGVMVLTAFLGIGFPLLFKNIGVDNWGHTGGAVIGAIVGLGHHRLLRNMGRPRACELGLLSLILIIGCGVAQGIYERSTSKLRTEEALRIKVRVLEQTNQIVRGIKPLISSQSNFKIIVAFLERLESQLDEPPTRQLYRRSRALAVKARDASLSPDETAEFQKSLAMIEMNIRDQLKINLDEFTAIRKQRRR
jgi:membrane associated rhomboid family serine protease